jgi:Zn-dependent M28 family amino/carboxypeptidase
MKRLLLPVFVLAGLSGIAQKQIANFAEKYSNTITPVALKEKLSVIAGAEMEGRETTTAGQRKAAAYIEDVFQKIGLVQGTSGGYQMQFPVYQDTLIEASLTVGGKTYKLDETWDLNISSAANGSFDVKEIMYASYGHIDSLRNDYKELDVKGKWVLIYESAPGGMTVTDKKFYIKNKIQKATDLGAKGVFIMSADFPRKEVSETKGHMFLKKQATALVPVIYVNTDLAHRLLGMNPAQLLQSLKNIPTGSYSTNTQYTINKRTLMLQSSNVLGVIPGTDKKDEYLIITAHYDHIGRKGKEIFYGADDDGSGTTAVLQLAEAFAKARNEGHAPRRSIIFMTVSGEEKGLLGSEFYSHHPAFPLDKTVVNLNIDMVGRIDPNFKGDSLNYVYVIGDDKLSSDLRKITDSVNKIYPRLQLDRKYNDMNDPNRFYYRSDHYNFAKNGVPAIFYFNGTHADYHKSTDTVDKINFDLMAKRVKLVYYTAWDMANRNETIKRDIPLPQLTRK